MDNDKKPIKVIDKDARGFFGKPGTFNHTLNLGCLLVLLLIAWFCCNMP